MHGLPPPHQLRPSCHQTACNCAQDRLGYVGQQKQVAKTTHTKHTDTNKPLEPGSPSSRGRRGQGATNPLPSSTPSQQQHAPSPPNAPQGRKSGEAGEETGQGERDEQREETGQGRPCSPKTVQSAEGGEGKERWGRILVVVRSPCQENYPADTHPSALKSVLESANPAWTRSVHLDAPGQRHRQQPVSGTGDPGVVKQDKSSGGSVDKRVWAHRGSD